MADRDTEGGKKAVQNKFVTGDEVGKIPKFYGFLEGENIYLRNVLVEDVNGNYHQWMNDASVNRYLESRFYPHSLDDLTEYVRRKLNDEYNVFFAIILKDGNRHIGNIKLGPISMIHRFADIGILIGEKDCWGKGHAVEAIGLVSKYAFDKLNLNKVTAGCYAPNKGAVKAFEKAGFLSEGIRKDHCFCDGQYVDDVLFGLTRAQYKKTRSEERENNEFC